jgi:hypothetical protein
LRVLALTIFFFVSYFTFFLNALCAADLAGGG